MDLSGRYGPEERLPTYWIRRGIALSMKQHAMSFMLPITVTIVFPLLLLYFTGTSDLWFKWPLTFDIISVSEVLRVLLSGFFLLFGLDLLGHTVRKFAREGEGTLSPLHPTKNLVVTGIYCHVRNPMIIGVLCIVLGESLVLPSFSVFLLCFFFFIGNHFYFIYSEEPGLVSRFGNAYLEYKKNVPRWIPRRTPWIPNAEVKEPPSNVP